jgi:hypothetical protein
MCLFFLANSNLLQCVIQIVDRQTRDVYFHFVLWPSPDFVVLDNYYTVNHLHHRVQTIDLVSPTAFLSDLTLHILFLNRYGTNAFLIKYRHSQTSRRLHCGKYLLTHWRCSVANKT